MDEGKKHASINAKRVRCRRVAVDRRFVRERRTGGCEERRKRRGEGEATAGGNGEDDAEEKKRRKRRKKGKQGERRQERGVRTTLQLLPLLFA